MGVLHDRSLTALRHYLSPRRVRMRAAEVAERCRETIAIWVYPKRGGN
jgi:hypothetical protein